MLMAPSGFPHLYLPVLVLLMAPCAPPLQSPEEIHMLLQASLGSARESVPPASTVAMSYMFVAIVAFKSFLCNNLYSRLSTVFLIEK